MLQGDRSDITLPITGSATTPVPSGIIVVADAANPGNAAVSTAAQNGFVGVTIDDTGKNGYTTVRTKGIVQIRTGAAVAAGDQVASNANGKAVPQTVAASGAGVKQIVGVALTSAATADVLVDVLLQPKYTVG